MYAIRSYYAGISAGIKGIAEDRVAERLHMHAQLMGTTGFGNQGNTRRMLFRIVGGDLESGQGRLADFKIDFVQRAVRPIDN